MSHSTEPEGYYTLTRQVPSMSDSTPRTRGFVALVTIKRQLLLGSFVLGFFFVRDLGRFGGDATSATGMAYIIMVWLEIVTNIIFSVMAFCYLVAVVPPGLDIFLTLSICWIIQASSSFTSFTFLLMDVWIPAQLQITSNWISVRVATHWLLPELIVLWDYVEKSLYLCLDLALNFLFIRTVKKRIVEHGLRKYDALQHDLITISITMDVLLLCLTLLPNYFVYAQFHGVVYIIKLQMEIILSRNLYSWHNTPDSSVSRFLVSVARAMGVNVPYQQKADTNTTYLSHSQQESSAPVAVHVATQVFTHSEHALDAVPNSRRDFTNVSTDGGDNHSQIESREDRKRQESSGFGSESTHEIKVVPLPFVPPEYSD
ncbi:hypothetical protein CPB85DRAFT_1434337 [Mucidula mucida]|nr:hypothetical protein CPB85DRAFT_1434337 [Mucidula mucida]